MEAQHERKRSFAKMEADARSKFASENNYECVDAVSAVVDEGDAVGTGDQDFSVIVEEQPAEFRQGEMVEEDAKETEIFDLIERGSSILNTFRRSVPLNLENEIQHTTVISMFEAFGEFDMFEEFGEFDQAGWIRMAVAGLQHAYEVLVKDDIIEDMKIERDEVKRDLEDVAKSLEERASHNG